MLPTFVGTSTPNCQPAKKDRDGIWQHSTGATYPIHLRYLQLAARSIHNNDLLDAIVANDSDLPSLLWLSGMMSSLSAESSSLAPDKRISSPQVCARMCRLLRWCLPNFLLIMRPCAFLRGEAKDGWSYLILLVLSLITFFSSFFACHPFLRDDFSFWSCQLVSMMLSLASTLIAACLWSSYAAAQNPNNAPPGWVLLILLLVSQLTASLES